LFSLEICFSKACSLNLALVKKQGILATGKPLSSQIRILMLDKDSPFEILHLYVCNTVVPFFTSFARSGSDCSREKIGG
jgi:hypothetical protein